MTSFIVRTRTIRKKFVRYVKYAIDAMYASLLLETAYFKILRARKANRTIYCVFDTICSPPSYGDFFNCVMLARLLATYAPTKFVYVNDTHRGDWPSFRFTSNSAAEEGQLEIARTLLKDRVDLSVTSWNEFKTQIVNNKESYIIFGNLVRRRLGIYSWPNSLMANLYRRSPSKESWLINSSDLQDPNFSDLGLQRNGYLAWNVRFYPEELHRNNTKDSIVETLDYLNRVHGNLPIVIVTDPNSVEHFKEIFERIDQKVVFAVSSNRGFVSDMSIVVNSRSFYCHNAGGMAAIAIHSNTKYEISQRWLFLPQVFSHVREIPWRRDSQFYFPLNIEQ